MDSTDWDPLYQFVVESNDDCTKIQVPTPPRSHDGSPSSDSDHGDPDVVNVSSTFFPGARVHSLPPDLILISSDFVFFYVSSSTLLEASNNGFGNLVPKSNTEDPEQQVVRTELHSNVLNVVLHAIHHISSAHYNHDIETLITAVDAMPSLGLALRRLLAPQSPLFSLLLGQAPLYPIQVYALASRYDLHDLAVPTSGHLLSYSLHQLDDTTAELMGPIYIKRLFFLHFGRMEALKRILLNPPHPHAPTPSCDFTEQKKITRAWALATAYLAWDARPDLSISSIESALGPLGEHLNCNLCKQSLKERVQDVVVQWSVVRRTI
ncbi:hypothetical protein BDV98DRAFT_613522 [Pterulicium gracile]|uniref:Uncharacterized protein n=1 Tax=Pterulicium gracile TaxID=1884261 RepID=A0A5C3QDA2_9AGAR|nr:hypothetical protein BDV98DRAFT_613522 [Pterula gracilis]